MRWDVRADGSFDLIGPAISLRGCYPATDGEAVHPISVRVDRQPGGGTITYELSGGTLVLRLSEAADSLVLAAALRGADRAPFWVQPCVGEVSGATRFFRQGLGFSGPSGFLDLARQQGIWSYESYLVSGLTAADGSALTIAAHDHRNYLQKTTLYNRQSRRGLINRHLERETVVLQVGFSTEDVRAGGDELVLPELHFRLRGQAWDAFHQTASAIGQAMGARVHQPPRYHWCSWYERGPYLSLAELQEFLKGLGKIEPRVPLQAVQIDDGYCTAPGDWLEPNHLWPGGMEAAFSAIREAGYTPGIWVAPFMVGSRSRLYREHPDWVIHDLEGEPYCEWRNYDGTRNNEETYALDASHPEAIQYMRGVFRTLRQWGARFFKTDFMDWGLKDSARVRRHNPNKTSVQCYREFLAMIRQEIGEDSYWLACIAPYAPFLGFADGARVANDVGAAWSEGGVGNMVQESSVGQYFNNVWWQNDPDVLYLRDYHMELNDRQITALALWQGILGTSINTSDQFHRLRPDRMRLWRFLRPQDERWTARLPYWGQERKLKVAARAYEKLGAWAVLAFNATGEAVTERLAVPDLIGDEQAFVFQWGPEGNVPQGKRRELVAEVPGHAAVLWYVSKQDVPPPASLTLGGAM